MTALAPADADGRSFCFRLTPVKTRLGGHETYLICASDEDARERWMQAIKTNAALRAGQKPHNVVIDEVFANRSDGWCHVS